MSQTESSVIMIERNFKKYLNGSGYEHEFFPNINIKIVFPESKDNKTKVSYIFHTESKLLDMCRITRYISGKKLPVIEIDVYKADGYSDRFIFQFDFLNYNENVESKLSEYFISLSNEFMDKLDNTSLFRLELTLTAINGGYLVTEIKVYNDRNNYITGLNKIYATVTRDLI